MNWKDEYRKYVAQLTDFEDMLIAVDHAEGIYLYDKSGKKYMDLLSGIAVNILGHKHPAVISAVRRQAERYLHLMVYGEFVQEETLILAKKLASLLPESLSKSFFVNSGSEAIEGAIKLAKLFTKRSEIIAFSGSYHGSTHATLNLLGERRFKAPFLPLSPDVRILQYNDFEGLKYITERTACVVLELIQTASGMVMPLRGFIQSVRERCSETGTLLIFDEMQTSLGRLGAMFGFQKFGVVPDILCLAKSLGGGVPTGVFISSEKIMNALDNGHPLIGHATTFGGNPLACAVASAVIDTLIRDHLVDQVAEKHKLFIEYLDDQHIVKISGEGLLLGVYPDKNMDTKKLVRLLLAEGIVSNTFLFSSEAFAIIPPLTISTEEIKLACQKINQVLKNAR
ncbi:MAG TPA: aspartate aminotransferase family protein [Bacteroidia bacterium]|nr:aspartate aminotransferase family protein [Bacteroidia bacterium]HRS59959.1 aspartate aminotransferase family protein [Bacteroidia bacterium]HRU69158.1 aspartate aminotransferase family protein [Bacteroidia bacterium]